MNLRPFVLASFVLATSSLHAQVAADWPAYNRTLDGQRFAPQTEITAMNVSSLKEVCRYDLHQATSFQTGPIVVDGVIYITTGHDTIALDGSTCAEKWRVHEDYAPAVPNDVNRGAAVLDGRVFRGTQDGRVLAYDAASGKRLWETTIADKAKAESIPTALIAWKGLVFAGNAGSEKIPVKGRIYALDAVTGRVVWEQYMAPRSAADKVRGTAAPAPKLVSTEERGGGTSWTAYTLDAATGTLFVPGGNPTNAGDNSYSVALDARTGAVKAVYGAVAHDFHDWEVSAAPTLLTTKAGKRLLVQTPKDGYAYAVMLPSGRQLWKSATTTVENAAAPAKAGGQHFCPGGQGGNEWNGAAYSPATDMVYAGAVDWCASAAPVDGGEAKLTMDSPATASGWVSAFDAESGKLAWHFHAPAPVLGGVTPTAGGVVFAGDVSGMLYAFQAKSGKVLWKQDVGGAIGGGIVSYSAAGGTQRVAVAAGMKSVVWPMAKGTAQLVVYGIR